VTPPPLAAVRWSSVLRSLLEHLDELPGELDFYKRPQGLLGPIHVLFAVTAVQVGRDRCIEATSCRIGTWLYDAARAAHRFFSIAPEPEWSVPAFTGWLRIDPRLPALPLLGLAAQHAERRRTPLLVTGGERLAPVIGGRTQRSITATIGPDTRPVDLVELRQQADWVWLHELAHVVDPVENRDPVTSEAFADTLGEMIRTTWPETLDQLDELTHAAQLLLDTTPERTIEAEQPKPHVEPGPTRHHDLPAPGLESVMVFASLPLTFAEVIG
jgi:hypothetical protein